MCINLKPGIEIQRNDGATICSWLPMDKAHHFLLTSCLLSDWYLYVIGITLVVNSVCNITFFIVCILYVFDLKKSSFACLLLMAVALCSIWVRYSSTWFSTKANMTVKKLAKCFFCNFLSVSIIIYSRSTKYS